MASGTDEWVIGRENGENKFIIDETGVGSHLVVYPGGNVHMGGAGGKVGIGVVSPSYKVHCAGTVYATQSANGGEAFLAQTTGGTGTVYGVNAAISGTAHTDSYGGFFNTGGTASGTATGLHAQTAGNSVNAYGVNASAGGTVTGDSYGVKSSASTSRDAGTHYGIHAQSGMTTSTGTRTNIGGYFYADGAANNYGLVVAAGNSGFGITSPAAMLHTKSSGIGTYGFQATASTGSSQFEIYEGTSNELSLWGKNTSGAVAWKITTDASSYFMGGNFGIGTAVPSAKLHTYSSGNGTYGFMSTASTGGSQIELYENASNELSLYGKNTSAAVKWKISSDESSYFNGGNVGIGNVSPGSLLSLGGGTAASTVVEINSTGRYKQVEFHHSGTRKAYVGYDSTSNVVNVTASPAASQIVFNTVDTEQMRIDASGRVGIGRTPTTYALEVLGTAYATQSANGGEALRATTTGGTGTVYGVNSAVTGTAHTASYGGFFSAAGTASGTATGIFSQTAGNSANAYGGNFVAGGTVTGTSYGIWSSANTSRSAGTHYGVYGQSGMTDTSGTRTNVGGYFYAAGASTNTAIQTGGGDLLVANNLGTTKLKWDAANERLGIGTVTPTMGIHVADGKGLLVGDSSSWNNVYISPTDGHSINAAYGYNGPADLRLNYRGYNDGFTQFRTLKIDNGKGAIIATFDGTTSRLGIGTSAPAESLDIVGNVKITDASTSSYGTLFFGSNAGRYLRGNSGEVQLGSALSQLHFQSTTTPGEIASSAASGTTAIKLIARTAHTSGNVLEVVNGSTKQLTVTSGGQVEQPIATPSELNETYTIDFSKSNLQSISVDSDESTFGGTITLETTGWAAGRTVKLRIKDTGEFNGISVTEPSTSGYASLGDAISGGITGGGTAIVELTSWSTTEANVTAEWSLTSGY
jgi:hypothetical protein